MAEEKIPILLRIPADKKRAFDELHPWHGSMTQFFLQCLDEFLVLSEGQKTPAALTSEAASTVFRETW